jgi:hypothetical protein
VHDLAPKGSNFEMSTGICSPSAGRAAAAQDPVKVSLDLAAERAI